MERRDRRRARRAVVPHNPLCRHGGHAMAGRVLSGLPDKPCDRYPDNRPSSASVSRQPRAGATVLVVSRLGTHARDYRFVCTAAARLRTPHVRLLMIACRIGPEASQLFLTRSGLRAALT